MHRIYSIAALALIPASLWAADFESGQAARAVIGQSSFSSREANITPTALAIAGSRLYAADASRRVFTYDLTQIPAAAADLTVHPASACALCGFSPSASVPQSVLPGIATVSSFEKTVVIADTAAHRVLIWRDTTLPRAAAGPDVILGALGEPISVAFDGKRLFVGDGALHRVLIWNSLPASDAQSADTVLGQPNLTSANADDIPGPDTIARPSALASDGTNLYVADAVDHRILVFTAADTPLPGSAVVNSASLSPGPLAPGTLITIGGRGLSDATESAPDGADQALPDRLGGAEVLLNGIALPLLSASPAQVRAQLPYNLGSASAASLYIRTQHDNGSVTTTNAIAVKLLPATPGLFAFGGAEPRLGMVLHTDAASGQPGAPVTSDDPAMPGQVLTFWTAGLGAVDSGEEETAARAGVPYAGVDAPVLSPVDALVNGREAQVISATLPQGSIGIYQVRVQLPADLPPDPKTPLLISQDGQLSNTVTIPVASLVP